MAVKIAESALFCQGLILIEPTTYSVLYGELAQNPYPEFLALQEKVQTLGGGYEYLKKIGQESFSVADFKILWAKAEKSSDRLKSGIEKKYLSFENRFLRCCNNVEILLVQILIYLNSFLPSPHKIFKISY